MKQLVMAVVLGLGLGSVAVPVLVRPAAAAIEAEYNNGDYFMVTDTA